MSSLLPPFNLRHPSTSNALDAINTITLPLPRTEPDITSASTQFTTGTDSTSINPESVRAAVRQALLDRLPPARDVPSASASPQGDQVAINITASDALLAPLQRILSQVMRADANISDDTLIDIAGLPSLINFRPLNVETDYYPLISTTHIRLAYQLYNDASLYHVGQVPSPRAFHEATPPQCRDGKTDFIGRVRRPLGDEKELVLWEFKRDKVLPLRMFIQLYLAAQDGRGIQISIKEDGGVQVRRSDDTELDIKLVKIIHQILVELDANCASTLLLTTWSHGILFHRLSPDHIVLSQIVTNDPNHPDHRVRPLDPRSELLTSIAPDWRLFKLIFTVLLCADGDELDGNGWKRKTSTHLPARDVKRRKLGVLDGSRIPERGSVPDQDYEHGGSLVDEEPGDLSYGSEPSSAGLSVDEASHVSLIPDLLGISDDHFHCRRNLLHNQLSPSAVLSFASDLHAESTLHLSSGFHGPDVRWHLFAPNTISLGFPEIPSSPSMKGSSFDLPIAADEDKPLACFSDIPVVHHLSLDHYISHGRLYDVYRGRISTHPGERVIFKLVDLDTFYAPLDHSPFCSDYTRSYSPRQALAAVLNETRLLSGPLLPLQGMVTPRFYGLYVVVPRNPHRVFYGCSKRFVIVLEDVGEISLSRDTLTPTDRSCITELYASLHSLSVIHNDVERRHVVRHHNRPGSWRIIDFEGAKGQASESEIQDELLVLEEMLG